MTLRRPELVPSADVGGYFKTALDPVFNGAGAASAMIIRAVADGPGRSPPR